MLNWLLMLGGMLVWMVHFAAIYTTSSVFDVISEADAPGARWTVGAVTIACLAANAALFALNLRGLRRDEVTAWMHSVGAILAALSFVSVAWQGLPAVIGS
jgi:hypothetical protein